MKNPIPTILMNTQTRHFVACAATVAMLLTAAPWTSPGQTFNSGSDGSYGPMNITVSTNLVVPPNGIFNCTSITIAGGAVLTFTKNALNTPVYLLATSGVSIYGTIVLSGGNGSGLGVAGTGGPGGFDGGGGGFALGCCGIGGDGTGPGGGKHSTSPNAVYAQAAGGNTNVYGNVLLSPLIGGSGGAGGDQGTANSSGPGGGGGGGAILIAANNSVGFYNGGSIQSYGGSGSGFGSGGAIRIVAPVVLGNGGVDTFSAPSNPGRIRIDCQDDYAYRTLSFNGVVTRGSQMFVFPPVVPTLSIIQAAGQAIPEGTNNSVVVNLPAGSSTNQTVTVRARGFTNDVPIVVSVVPANGSSSNYPVTIVMTNNPSQTSVNVVIPSGMYSSIQAWTR